MGAVVSAAGVALSYRAGPADRRDDRRRPSGRRSLLLAALTPPRPAAAAAWRAIEVRPRRRDVAPICSFSVDDGGELALLAEPLEEEEPDPLAVDVRGEVEDVRLDRGRVLLVERRAAADVASRSRSAARRSGSRSRSRRPRRREGISFSGSRLIVGTPICCPTPVAARRRCHPARTPARAWRSPRAMSPRSQGAARIARGGDRLSLVQDLLRRADADESALGAQPRRAAPGRRACRARRRSGLRCTSPRPRGVAASSVRTNSSGSVSEKSRVNGMTSRVSIPIASIASSFWRSVWMRRGARSGRRTAMGCGSNVIANDGRSTSRARATTRLEDLAVPEVHAVEVADRADASPRQVGRAKGVAHDLHGVRRVGTGDPLVSRRRAGDVVVERLLDLARTRSLRERAPGRRRR